MLLKFEVAGTLRWTKSMTENTGISLVAEVPAIVNHLSIGSKAAGLV
jgi:hypothetical protein